MWSTALLHVTDWNRLDITRLSDFTLLTSRELNGKNRIDYFHSHVWWGFNPYHTKQVKELDDNSQIKSDKKDTMTIAHLVQDG